MNRLTMIAVTALTLTVSSSAWAIPIGGIEFPQGAISFADAVVSFTPGPDVGANFDNPLSALGVPDAGAVSLGISVCSFCSSWTTR